LSLYLAFLSIQLMGDRIAGVVIIELEKMDDRIRGLILKFCGFLALFLCVYLLGVPGKPAFAHASLELYGTFHAMGIIVTIDASDDPNANSTAQVEYRESGQGLYRQGFPLTRVAETRFVGSLFWLAPGVAYEVRVTFSDPDTDPLDGVLLQSSSATRVEINIPAASHSYYVSPTGSGVDCSLIAPCALAEGLDRVQAGEEVVLRGGVYYQGDLYVPRSGGEAAPIVIRGYPNETAILDGDDPATFVWVDQGSGIYRTTVNVADTFLVTANGERLLPYRSLADLQNLVWGVPGFFIDGTALSVRLAGNADPNSSTMVVSRFGNAFTVEQDYIYFLNLTFRQYGVGECCPKALYFNNADNNLVQGCTFVVNNLGIGFKRDSQRNVIQDNLFYDTIFHWPWDAFYAGQVPYGGGGIRLYDPMDGRGTIIRRNTFHDLFDGFGACPESTSAVTNETDVYENLVYNAGDDGMETDGRCSNVRIWGNTFHDVLMGISLAPVYDGPVYAIRNLVYRTGAGNNDYTGSPFKFNSGYDPSGSMYLFHNTSDAALTDPRSNGLYIKSPGAWDMIYARNNIWAGTDYALENYNTSQPVDLDYDNLWNDSANDLVRWENVRYATLAAFTTATGQEMHGMNSDPAFSDPGNGDYTLVSTSGLIDAGALLPGINADYSGRAPDLGAFEFTPALLLHGRVGNQTITLDWAVDQELPAGSSWRIDYIGPPGDQPSPITNLPVSTHSYKLTGLANGAWYDLTLSAILEEAPILSGAIRLMPTDQIFYLPIMVR
jgi:hypothetical protein